MPRGSPFIRIVSGFEASDARPTQPQPAHGLRKYSYLILAPPSLTRKALQPIGGLCGVFRDLEFRVRGNNGR